MATPITPEQLTEDHDLPDWRWISFTIQARFRAGAFTAGGELVARIAAAADAANHHPDVDLRYPGVVQVTLTTHAPGGGEGFIVTDRDVALAAEISSLAAAAGCEALPTKPEMFEMAIDAMDIDAVRPFWAAVLGYDVVDDQNLLDPERIRPPVWFQQMDQPREQRNRIHVDVVVPHDVAESRIAAALEAGGTMVTDEYARSWWVLADPEGNEACVCTWQDRS